MKIKEQRAILLSHWADSRRKTEHELKGLIAKANDMLLILASGKTPSAALLEARLKEVQEALSYASRCEDKLDLLARLEEA